MLEAFVTISLNYYQKSNSEMILETLEGLLGVHKGK